LDITETDFLPEDAYCIIGLINKDLYPRKGWNFVFGITRLVRRSGIFSLARYDPDFLPEEEKPEYLNLEPKDRENLILQRACKTMTHEIAHMFWNPTLHIL
jgi:predicted Zn-dependent protease